MEAYCSIAVARAGGEIVSRSLIKAETNMTLRALFGMYEGGKHVTAFMDPAVKAGTRTAIFEQHDATMDLVDLDMPICLIREICGDVTKFLFQLPPTIIAAPALVPPPAAPVAAATMPPRPVLHASKPTPVAVSKPTPVAVSKPKPVPATRGRKPRKAVVVDSFLRESDLNRIGDVITVAPRAIAQPATKPASRYSTPVPATRTAEVHANARTTAVLPDGSASALARLNIARQMTMPPLNKNALGRILESVKAKQPVRRPVSPKARRARPHYFSVADDDAEEEDNDSDASVADDDDVIEVVEAPVTKRASRRLALPSPAPVEPPPRRELRIPQLHKTSVPRSRTQRLPARRAALRKSNSTEMVLSADGAVVMGNVLGRSSDADVSPRLPQARRPTRRTSAPRSAEKVLPQRTSTRNKSIVEISSDDEARPVPSLTRRLRIATPTTRTNPDTATESPQVRPAAVIKTPTKQPSPPKPRTPAVDVAQATMTLEPKLLPDLATPKFGPTGTPDVARKKRLLSLDDTVEEQVHDLSPPAKRRLSSFADFTSSPVTLQLSSEEDVPSSADLHTTDETETNDDNNDPQSAIEDELATLLHEASAVELVQLREANPNDQANFLWEELNEVKRHVLLQKTANGLFQVAFKKATHADIAPHENPNVVMTNLFMHHDDDWSRVANLVSLGRSLRPAP